MLKKLKMEDIDDIMFFWKEEILKSDISQKSKIITSEYTNTRKRFIENILSTIVYTEDGVIEGFISVDKEQNIWNIVVKNEIRREGIGRILLENVKKENDKLTININKNNKIAQSFIENMGFKKIIQNEELNFLVYTWKRESPKSATVIYFDNDIEKEFIKPNSKVNYNSIKVKQFIKRSSSDGNEIKLYLKLRKEIESAMDNKNILLYIDYNNYYENLDEQIKELAKIKKVNLNLLLCEPFTIENSKRIKNIKAIEKSYQDYKIHKIDFSMELDRNININQISRKRSELLLEKIEKIAENM